jgi:hypothetical protein
MKTQRTWLAGLMPGEALRSIDGKRYVFVRETASRISVRRADGRLVSVLPCWFYGSWT